MTARHSVANHSGVFDLDQIFASRNRDSYVTGVIRAFPASFGRNVMRDGFPDIVAAGLVAFAFALSLFVFFAFGGLH